MSDPVDALSAGDSPSVEPPIGTRILLGAYTAEMDGSATGLISLLWRSADAEQVDIVAHEPVELASPTWVEAHPGSDLVFSCAESSPGVLIVLRMAADGSLSVVRRVETGGHGGCHLTFSPDGRIVVVANYGDGSVSSFSAVDDDTLGDRLAHHAFDTSGPDPERQEHAHAHQAVFVDDTLLVPDLGGDVVHRLAVAADGSFTPAGDPVALPPGSGPRHLVVVGDHLVVACELSARLWVARRDGDTWTEVGQAPASSRTVTEDVRIYPSGIAALERHVVVANRGSDSFATFAIDDAGALTLLTEQDTVGAWPRDLSIVDGRLWIATQVGNAVASYRPDADGRGWLKDLEFETPSPSRVAIAGPQRDAVEVQP